MTLPAAAVARPSFRRDVWAALAVVVLAMAVRAPRMSQSLWLDEMATLVGYVLQPWSKVLAPQAGQYIPNNHVLHTVLAKLAYSALAGGRAAAEAGGATQELVLRLPAFVAGSLLPAALAWPLRRRSPLLAVAVAVVAAVHPWLVVLGAEARGYTLMLLLGVLATNLLPSAGSTRRRLVGYGLALAGTIYAVPLAVLLVPAHAAAVALCRRDAARRWAVGAVIGIGLTVALYLPMVRGLASYYRRPFEPTTTVRQFLDALPRHALAGRRLPVQPVDLSLPPPLDRRPDPPGAAVFWALPVLVVTLGTALGWTRFPDARPLLATTGAVTVLAVLLAVAVPTAAEVRFDTWAAVWFCLTVAMIIVATATVQPVVVGRSVAAAAAVVLLALFGRWDAQMPPNQPVREAMALAGRLAPPGRPIVVAYLGGAETVFCYGSEAGDRMVLPAPDADTFRSTLAAAGPRPPWVVILFEEIARDRNATGADARGLWTLLTDRFVPVARLPGRLTPVAVYAPRDDGPPAVGRHPVAMLPAER